MKAFLLILLVVGSYYIAVKLFTKHDLEIEENLVISQSQNIDMNLLYISPVSKQAYIEGVVRNISDQSLKNISIVYLIGQDTAAAKIFYLLPGQSQKFRTNNCPIVSTSPGYALLNKIYEKE